MNKTKSAIKHTIIALVMIVLNGVEASASTPWTVSPGDYRYDMSLYLDVSFADSKMDYSRYDVGVFCGDECRGVAEVLPLGDEDSCLYVRVRSTRESGETMTFKYHDKETDKTYDVDGESFAFESSGRLGYPSEPYTVAVVRHFDVTLSAGIGGTVNHAGGRFAEGTELTLTATPDEGYHFEQWSDGSVENPRSIVVDEDMDLTAEFAANTYTLTVYLNNEVYSSSDVEYGTVLIIDDPRTPEGTVFSGWESEIPETMPAHDLDIYGTYSKISAIRAVSVDCDAKATVYSITGRLLCKDASWNEIAASLADGIYIVNGQKVILRR